MAGTWAEALPLIEEQLDKLVPYGVRRRIMAVVRNDLIAPRFEGTPEVGLHKAESEDEADEIWIQFSRRDWQFDAKTGNPLGAGTFLG